ncbi:pancreatic triacylglycerol lipase-like [Agrilus planipennis]|uniref:Pancreatic triacylglycerol lipase-like n=1 Tax=Agrilus planipennis TaxID=224129 RepID=A0A7F5R8D3_AGRPL|nr:pancreatic triacylglycerol lipase-like [Agrilus planipennis]
MKLLFVLANVAFVLSNPLNLDTSSDRFITVYSDNGVTEVIDTLAPIPEPFASASDITLYLYTQKNPSSPEELALDVSSLSSSSYYDSSKQNIFVIHGWRNDQGSDVNEAVRSAYLEVLDANVFVVDWSSVSYSMYTVAFSNVPSIGRNLGRFISSMQSSYGLDADQFTLVGHSLGAHVAGCAGSAADSNVGVIVGMDPAGPMYFNIISNNRLDPSDAKFVHVIHTCGGRLGYQDSLGTADYRPNGGRSQPGCGADIAGTCAHSRAYQFFAESVKSGGFTATSCNSSNNYNSGNCASNGQSKLGGLNIDTSASGNYYLNTNSQSPYSES